MNEANDLTHFSDAGRARMVDVSAKAETLRAVIGSCVSRRGGRPGKGKSSEAGK